MSERPILMWLFADVAERNGTGTDNGLVVGQVSYVVSTNTFYYCATAAATTSTWTATATGSGQTLAATLAVGDVTGGTQIEFTAGDPLTMNENASVPGGAPAAGKGVLWVKNTTPNTIFFTDDAGTDHDLTPGAGDVVGPGTATDNAIVRFDGATGKLVQNSIVIVDDTGNVSGIVNITLSGTVDGRDVAADGSTLDAHVADMANPHTTTLALALAGGNVTSGTGIEVSVSDPFTLNENASVPGGAPAGGKGVIWVKNATPNELWFTDDGGTDHQLGVGSTPALGAVLAVGNTSAGTDLEMSVGDAFLMVENASVPWVPVATKGALWVKTGTPNTLWFTDDAGTDFQVSGVGSNALDNVLVAGNTTGGTGIEISAADPLLFNENATVPGGAPGAAKGTLWVRSDTPNVIVFTDDAGTDHNLLSPSMPTLSQVLTAGNTTGGDDISVNGGSVISFATTSTTLDDTSGTFTVATSDAQGVVVDTSGGSGPITLTTGGNAINIDYATWPASDGIANQVLSTNGAGTLSWAAGSQALSAVLAVGNTTGGTDMEVSTGDAFLLVENAAVPWSNVATKGAIWIKDDAPNTLYFTDDDGTDWLIGGTGAGETLAQTLALGNATGGTDIEISVGDEIVGASPAGPVNVRGGPRTTAGVAGAVLLIGGTSSSSATGGGNATVQGGPATANNADGGIVFVTGGSPHNTGDAGAVVVAAGAGTATAGSLPGNASFTGGQANAGSTTGGTASVVGGRGNGSTSNGGPVNITGGQGTASGGAATVRGGQGNIGGAVNLIAGLSTGSVGAAISATAGDGSGAFNGGSVTATAGQGGATGAGGNLTLTSGDGGATSGNSGGVTLASGSVSSGNGGNVTITGADGSATAVGGSVTIEGGDTSGAGTGGTININAGTTTGGTDGSIEIAGATNIVGDVDITGKLTVSGLVDPTGLVLSEQGADPASTGAGEGTFWVKNDAPTVPYFTDDGGTDHELAYAADIPSTPALSAVLATGNTTGGTTIEISTGDYVEGEPAYLYGSTPAANRVQQFTARDTIIADAAEATLAVAYTLTADETAVMLRGDVTGIGQSDADNLVRGTFEGTWFRSGGTVTAGVTTVVSQGINGATTDDPAWTISVDISGDDIRIRITSSDSGGTNTTITYVANWTAQEIL